MGISSDAITGFVGVVTGAVVTGGFQLDVAIRGAVNETVRWGNVIGEHGRARRPCSARPQFSPGKSPSVKGDGG